MHENVVLIVVDELAGNIVNKTFNNGIKVMPFLQQLSKKSVTAVRMYSQAPYTEAAIRGLLYGHGVLDRLDNLLMQPDFEFTYYKYLEQEGYDVYSMSSDLNNGTLGKRYQQNIVPNSWEGLYRIRLKYLEPYVLQGEENAGRSYAELLAQALGSCINFYESLYADDFSTYHFRKFFQTDQTYCKKVLTFYKKEYEELKQDERAYVRCFIEEKKYLRFRQQEKWIERQRIEEEALREYIIERYNKIIKKLKRASRHYNLKNTRIPMKTAGRGARLICKGKWKEGFELIKLLCINYRNLLTDVHAKFYERDSVINRRAITEELFGSFLELIEHRSGDKPFFAYFHPNDIHGPADFIPAHVCSREEADQEFDIAEAFVKSLPEDFKGSVNYYTTARIVDERIKKFYMQLKQRGFLDNTYFIVTSDHGTSYMYDCIRPDVVNNFYDTQYRIPFILYKNGIESERIDSFTSAKDIPATLFELLGIAVPQYFTGKNLLNPEYHSDYVIHEYFGGGCPDFYHRPIRFCIRDRDYKVVYYVPLGGTFQEGSIIEIHDLQKDPMEINNLADLDYDRTAVNNLLGLLKKRFDEVNKEYQQKDDDEINQKKSTEIIEKTTG